MRLGATGDSAAGATTLSLRAGLEWPSGRQYLFLGGVPGGGNLGEPFPSKAAAPNSCRMACAARRPSSVPWPR